VLCADGQPIEGIAKLGNGTAVAVGHNDGLALLEVPHGEVCAARCSGEGAECPLPDLLTCRHSLCVIADPW
jgi:hypothetical protein